MTVSPQTTTAYTITATGFGGTAHSSFSITVLPDTDHDGLPNEQDNCPTVPNGPGLGVCMSGDTGGLCHGHAECGEGGVCDMSQTDADEDGAGDVCDNCPATANTDQADGDFDGAGDVCDNCPAQCNTDQLNADGDAYGDVCDQTPNCGGCGQPVCGQICSSTVDTDADGVNNEVDNCPAVYNPGQADGDGDHVGNVCDNCPETANPDQQDDDHDGKGDICETPTVMLSASPEIISMGQTTTLTWSSADTTSCIIQPGSLVVAACGSITITPTTTTTYTITATGPGGSSVPATVTVVMRAAVSITADPPAVLSGESTTISWSATEAASCLLEPDNTVVSVSGSVEKTLINPTTYTITAHGTTGIKAIGCVFRFFTLKMRAFYKNIARSCANATNVKHEHIVTSLVSKVQTQEKVANVLTNRPWSCVLRQ